jgi:sodium-independent sulfate anion transporter 11
MALNTSEGNQRSTTRIGHGLAKVLGIKLNRNYGADEVTRGESVFSMPAADTFVEDEPTSAEWIRSLIPDSQSVKQYFISLFPFLKWITRYNYTWLAGDTVAGEIPLL